MQGGKVMETAFRSDGRFTQAQFLEWLDENEAFVTGACELLDGAIVMAPPARYPHGDVVTSLVVALANHVASHGLGRVYESSMGFELPSGDTVEPDVSFLSTQRYAKGPAPRTGQMLRTVPDLVIEVLSPSTAARDRTEKKTVYARSGVSEYWLANPTTRTVVIHSLVGGRYDDGREYAAGAIHSSVLPRLCLTIEEVFSRLDRNPPR